MGENMQRSAEIAGGGIAGLSMGTMLARTGWKVRVHEQSSEIREIGAGIYIKNNALEVLESLDILPRMERYGTALERAQIQFADGTTKHDRLLAGSSRVHTFRRQVLIEALRDVALESGVEIVTGSQVRGVKNGALLTSDGAEHEADLVVGADGVHS